MNVFLSWSQPRSEAVAHVLAKYLPSFVNQVKPWLSSKDIASGARWSAEIASNLEAANIGIICLTAENQKEPWILFEAGAIAKLTSVGRAMVLRIGLKATEVVGPLSQFQSVGIERNDLWKLIQDINKAADSPVAEQSLEITFKGLWPTIEAELGAIAMQSVAAAVALRSPDEMLQELLTLARRQDQASQQLLAKSVTADPRALKVPPATTPPSEEMAETLARLEFASQQLKIYLDDIDRRLGTISVSN